MQETPVALTLSPSDVTSAIRNTLFSAPILILVLLFSLSFISALSLIYTKSLYRHYFIQLQELEAARDALHTEWTQLLLEESTWAAHARISKIATTELGMKDPDPDEIQIIIPRPITPLISPETSAPERISP
jgi:cell division protein FtsL